MGEVSKTAGVGEVSKDEGSPLLPDRYPTPDFFVCDLFDAAPKGDMASMEHPIFSLSTKPDRRIRRYEHRDHFVQITPSVLGLATMHDRDILIYCISQLMAGLNDGHPLSKTVRFKAHDLLKATNRMTNGQGYNGLRAALERLRGTMISTNLITGGAEQLDIFGLIDRARIVRQTRDGRMQDVEITLSDWVFNAIRAREVLTLHRDYFRLRKPLERRIYELARKHCGQKEEWRISLELLQKKCGSSSTSREFRRLVQTIVTQDRLHGHMPDYALSLDGDRMVFANRRTMRLAVEGVEAAPVFLAADTHAAARAVAPGWDVHMLEGEWRAWMKGRPGRPALKHPDRAFVGFCKAWVAARGRP